MNGLFIIIYLKKVQASLFRNSFNALWYTDRTVPALFRKSALSTGLLFMLFA